MVEAQPFKQAGDRLGVNGLAARLSMTRVVGQDDRWKSPDIDAGPLQGKPRDAIADMPADDFGLYGQDRVLNGALAPEAAPASFAENTEVERR